ncbi:hypothetical protein K466DRAFT_610662 [Polyporus arcularius HHB13444]|uniref:RNase H type-1 domain-containing protein n=1 Tax=Polyporus arcularius HHB13444 TaxID=1314778 RepID=A0A5C3NT62_9APHY|nr:hypothetical protein K466DRAFT_610662 [Polyporus arcularius HHB13444]
MSSSNSRLIIETDSQTTIDSLTKWSQRHEDTGYICQKNAMLLRYAVAKIRMRSAHTILKWIKGHNGHLGNEEADRLAARGVDKPCEDSLSVHIPPQFRVSGAKLQALTQKLAYKAIRACKDKLTAPRPRAVANLDRISCGISDAFGIQVTDEAVWSSFRTRHIARSTAQFMWMAVHDGYMIGSHWFRPNMSDELRSRAYCTVCGEVETMTHIIFECRAPGQETMWSLLKTTWTLTGKEWKAPMWGTAFGAACAIFKKPNGGRDVATASLWTILCTETLHLIWKMRCERVIQHEGRSWTPPEITNRFYASLNSRLDLDRRTSAMSRGKRSLRPADVASIWLPVVDGKDNLPPNWVTDNGVLVGIKRGR